MARLDTRVECRIRIEREEIRYTVSFVRLEQYLDRHHLLKVGIKHGRGAEAQDFLDFSAFTGFLGKSISLSLEPRGGVVEDARKLEFVGVVTQVNLENTVDGLNQVVFTAHSPTIALDGAPRYTINVDQMASDIINDILQQYEITVGKVTSTQKTIPYSVQYHESDYAYVMRLATSHGLFAFYDGQKFHAVKADGSRSEELRWRQTLGLFSLGLGTASPNQGTRVWDPVGKEVLASEFTGAPSGAAPSQTSRVSLDASEALYRPLGFTPVPKAADMASIDAALTRAKEAAVGRMVTCLGESIVPALAVGMCARVAGMDRFDGQYYVTSVTHLLEESGQYHNEFVCIPLDVAYASLLHQRLPITHLQSALVTDNNDPEKLGRVKVKFAWTDGGTSLWVRMAQPYAGKDRGWYTIPEINDEVLVGFEHGDPDMPVVIGSLYNSKDTPHADGPDPDDKVKMFTTRSGNQVIFTDADGSEEIKITQKDGKNVIVLGLSGPAITVQSEGDVKIKGATIALESTGGDITIKSSAALKQESSADLQLKAGANFKAEGSANCEIKGGAQTKVEGGAMTEVKGAIVKIN